MAFSILTVVCLTPQPILEHFHCSKMEPSPLSQHPFCEPGPQLSHNQFGKTDWSHSSSFPEMQLYLQEPLVLPRLFGCLGDFIKHLLCTSNS